MTMRYCLLSERMWRVAKRACGNLRTQIGLILLLVNVPFGYSALAICSWLFLRTGLLMWTYIGGACYALSWLMLLTGTYLTGKQVKDGLWRDLKRTYRSWRKFVKRKEE